MLFITPDSRARLRHLLAKIVESPRHKLEGIKSKNPFALLPTQLETSHSFKRLEILASRGFHARGRGSLYHGRLKHLNVKAFDVSNF